MTAHSIAVIPARGGSKRIPGKNSKAFCGKPMIAWSIQAALDSGLFQQIIVSTDDEHIAETAEKCGASAPFRRPAELSDDHTPTQPVIAHAIQWLQQENISIDAVCCLYATAPFVTAAALQQGWETIQNPHIRYAFAATEFAFPIQRGFYLDAAGQPQMFQPEHALTRSQDLPAAYHDAGQFYWARPDIWLSDGPIFSADSRPILLPRKHVQDIDTPDDWQYAELMMQALRLNDSA